MSVCQHVQRIVCSTNCSYLFTSVSNHKLLCRSRTWPRRNKNWLRKRRSGVKKQEGRYILRQRLHCVIVIWWRQVRVETETALCHCALMTACMSWDRDCIVSLWFDDDRYELRPRLHSVIVLWWQQVWVETETALSLWFDDSRYELRPRLHSVIVLWWQQVWVETETALCHCALMTAGMSWDRDCIVSLWFDDDKYELRPRLHCVIVIRWRQVRVETETA